MPRPRTPLLDRARIADAALELVDRTGDLTMVALARRLNVAPSALYHHVHGRDEVVALMREQMARSVDSSRFDTDEWQDAVRTWVRSYRDVFARWPGIVQFFARQPIVDPVLHRMYEDVIGGLERAGFAEDVAIDAVTALESFALGSVLDLAAPGAMMTDIDAAANPRLASAVRRLPTGQARADRAFEYGLSVVIAGLDASLKDRRA